MNPGAPLDIIIKLESTFNLWCTPFINYFIGGHAAICMDEYKSKDLNLTNYDLIETTYNNSHKEVFVSSKAYWENTSFTEKYIILRVKGLTDEDRNEALHKAISMIGDPYNLTFIMNTKNSHYCSASANIYFIASHNNLWRNSRFMLVFKISQEYYSYCLLDPFRRQIILFKSIQYL